MENSKDYSREIYPFYRESQTGKYSQFTIDFGSGELNPEKYDDAFCQSRHYRVENVLAIIDEAIPDFDFFTRLESALRKITQEISTREKFVFETLKLIKGEMI